MNLDTPALLINHEIVNANCRKMQAYADKQGVTLRPHTKTHKMSEIAQLQTIYGARGITVAKTGEAEVMAKQGLTDIFIANIIVGDKLSRIKKLARTINISFGMDSIDQADMIDRVFKGESKPAKVLIEIEVGENRTGIDSEEPFLRLLNHLDNCNNIQLEGVFSHEGHCYEANDPTACEALFNDSQLKTVKFAEMAQEMGHELNVISIGSTPSLMFDFQINEKITEIRPGTYVFMDASQANAYGSKEHCAATVLATVISKPTSKRVVLDVGAKGITAQTRSEGFSATRGLGLIKGWPDVHIETVYDEHAIINNSAFRDGVKIGDKVEIIPNHICPVVNLYETAFLISGDEVDAEIPVDCRGKLS